MESRAGENSPVAHPSTNLGVVPARAPFAWATFFLGMTAGFWISALMVWFLL